MKPYRLVVRVLFIWLSIMVICTSGWSQTPVPQGVLWRVNVDGTDRMTTAGADERDAFPVEGQIFYVPIVGCGLPGTTTSKYLFRYNNGPDHMDSIRPVPGYTQEGPLGCPWLPGTSLPGLMPMFEAFNPTTGDHALTHVGEKLSGYTRWKPLGVMGYQRYNNAQEVLLHLKAGRISVDSNLVAGGNLWHWNWNGLQYLNLAGYPRGMHSQMFFEAAGGNGAAYASGDTYSFFPDIPANIHGAPLITAFNLGDVQTTMTVPLELLVDDWGGSVDNPVVWQDLVFGKELTLNFQNNPTVARYRAYLYYPAPGNQSGVGFSAPATFLRGLFTRYFAYDAVADQLTELTNQIPRCASQEQVYDFVPTFGGIIVSDETGDYAMGVYGANLSVGGSINDMTLRPRICPELGGGWENPTSESSYSTVVLRAGYNGPITQEITAFNTYFVTDKLTKVRAAMHKLYLTGVK